VTPEQAAREICDEIAACALDPLRFVQFAYPWGTGDLAGETGPRDWQTDGLRDIGARLAAGYAPGEALMPVLMAVASGHGIGKSTFLAWMADWAMSTCVDCKVVLTANTGDQLRTKTMPEIVKWFQLSINRDWFDVTATSITSRMPGHDRSWRMDAVTWSENRLAAFAGLHNKGKRIVLLFDEASGIADPVWEVAQGALTDVDTEIVWIAFGQPAEVTGAFFKAITEQKDVWKALQIDSRTVPGTNLKLFEQWAKMYGEDSDFFRVRVRGVFPRSGSNQFIPTELVADAMSPDREAVGFLTDPMIMGVDVARNDGGGDQTVLRFRKGRDARTHKPVKLRTRDTMLIAATVAEWARKLNCDAVFIDGGGVGGGVVDRCRQIGVYGVIEVQFGAAADRITFDDTRPAYFNKRAEMWGNCREWLNGGALDDDPELRAQLGGVNYTFQLKDGRDAILLEPKAAVKLRTGSSPDDADALVLTFAYPVMPRANAGGFAMGGRASVTEHDPFKGMHG
jgi:hypothetical protein